MVQRRINKGDQKAGMAVDPRVFLGVAERLAELRERGEYQRYRDDKTPPSSTARAMPIPRGEVAGAGRGGGVPSTRAAGGGEGEELVDFMSMDISGGGAGEGEYCFAVCVCCL